MTDHPPNMGKPLKGYEEFREHLLGASFHFADDTGGEWGAAHRDMDKAARVAIENRWQYWQIVQALRARLGRRELVEEKRGGST